MVLLRKSIPQSRNLKAAAELNVMKGHMITLIKNVMDFDICRDGGTLVAQFHGYWGRQFSLEFPIDLNSNMESEKQFPYKSPVLIKFTPSFVKCKITGQKFPKSIQTQKEVSWVYANKVMRKLKAKALVAKVEREDICHRMLEVSSFYAASKNS